MSHATRAWEKVKVEYVTPGETPPDVARLHKQLFIAAYDAGRSDGEGTVTRHARPRVVLQQSHNNDPTPDPYEVYFDHRLVLETIDQEEAEAKAEELRARCATEAMAEIPGVAHGAA